MKDLYRRIGLDYATTDLAAIERAIGVTSILVPSDAHAARHVLLNPQRKPTYDRTRSTLIIIGHLRQQYRLTQTQNWTKSDCTDFDRLIVESPRPLDPPESTAHLNSSGRPDKTPIAITVLAIAFFLLIFIVVGASGSKNKNSHTSSGRLPTDSVRDTPLTTQGTATLPQRTKPHESKVRTFVLRRYTAAGLAGDSASIETAVRRILDELPDETPATGVLRRAFLHSSGVAPLEIKTSYGQNFYIKVVDWSTKQTVLTAFIRGGAPFETKLPVGSYEIRYASGQSWYGSVLDFGPNASYSRCDDRFDFASTYDGYTGYTIELILQRNGNLVTDPLSADDF